MAHHLPALLGHLRKYYGCILVDAGRHVDNPVLSVLLSQSDNIVLVRNANASADSAESQRWQEVVSYATDSASNSIDNFWGRVIVLSDDCSARGENAARPVSNHSALYKSHFYLHTTTALALTENEERQFTCGLHRIARKLSNTTRGLALAGGGARALAHMGALEVFHSENIDFDGIAGASMGALIAANYAMGKDPENMIQLLHNLLPNASVLLDKTLPLVSFFKGRKLNRIILKIFSRIRFEDLDIHFYCNGSDLVSGRTIVFEKGYLATALRASVSLPAIFPPLDIGPYRLVDGGVLNNLPGNILREKGFRKIIGINILKSEASNSTSTHIKDRRGDLWGKFKDYFSMPPIINIVNRSVEIQGDALAKFREAEFDYILYPEAGDFGFFDFARAEEIIEKGREATLANLERIKAVL